MGREPGRETEAGRLGYADVWPGLSYPELIHSLHTNATSPMWEAPDYSQGYTSVFKITQGRNFQKMGSRQMKPKSILKSNGSYEGRPTECCEWHTTAGQTVWRSQGGSLKHKQNQLRLEGWNGAGQLPVRQSVF